MLKDPVRRRRAVLALAAALGLAVALALVGVTLGWLSGDDAGGGSGGPSPADTGTPLAELDTSALTVTREPFCEAVPAAAVLRALGLPTHLSTAAGAEAGAEVSAGVGAEVEASSWENGQVVRLEPGLRDVAHEHGCSWQAPGGVRARAWVFVPPTTPTEAQALRASTVAADGCTPDADAAAYGSFSAAVDCTDGRSRERVHAGLLGDAWLTCTLRAPRSGASATTREGLAGRASTWCSAVASAAASTTDASPAG